MKKIILRSVIISAIISAVINMAGFFTNLIAYHTTGKLVFYKELLGGEWVGYYGFGILMNRTFPMTLAGDPNANGQTWLSFDPKGLLLQVAAAFLGVLAISIVIRLVKAGIS